MQTDRLLLRRPTAADAAAIFERYAADPEVTRWLGWPRHRALDDSRAFVACSDAEWQRSGRGPLLILARDSGRLLGSTGLQVEAGGAASTGYVLARDAWGRGYATEALGAVVADARAFGLARLEALCHRDHAASQRVLAKQGFAREALVEAGLLFPNLAAGPARADVWRYGRAL